jgi:zinc transport system substrate-binding protein
MGLLGFGLIMGIVVLFFAAKKPPAQKNVTKKLTVTASFYPLAYLSTRIGGEQVKVINLTPVGAEPHDFEPTTKDMAKVERSDLLIMNGMGVEAYEQKLTEQLKGSSVKIVLAGSEYATKIMVKEGVKRRDPHVWIDPIIYGKMARKIANEMGNVDATHAREYTQRADQLIKELNMIDRDYQAGLANCTLNKIVTAHTAFGYLAKRYRFKQIGISGLSPEEEPSPKELQLLTDLVRKEGVGHILLEELAPRVWGETIANETGAKILVLNPIEGVTPAEENQGINYLSIQRENLETLKIALKCH